MLALTDSQLALLAIGVTRYPTAAGRAALLQRFAAVADPGPPRRLLHQRARSARARQRRRDKVRAYAVLLSNRAVEGLMQQLIMDGRLSARAAADRACFQAALTRLLEEQGSIAWAP
jgi:hypothetical protein